LQGKHAALVVFARESFGKAPNNCRLSTVCPIRTKAWNGPGHGIKCDLGGTVGKGDSKVKSIKMFGLAVLAALMAMAFVGACSAMAESTQLCKVDPGAAPCPGGNAVTNVHEVSVGKIKFLASPEIQCNALFSSTSVGALASPQIIQGHFTYTNCGCTVREKAGTTTTIEVLKTGHETAVAVISVTIEIPSCFGENCTYDGVLVATFKGPLLSAVSNPTGDMTISGQEVEGEGFFCPEHMELDATMTPLSATYIAG
jgi:hypothetical protein